jgi:hypothetical protein
MTFDQVRSQLEQRLGDSFDRDRYPNLTFAVAPKGADNVEVHITLHGASGMAFGAVTSRLDELDPNAIDGLVARIGRKVRELTGATG